MKRLIVAIDGPVGAGKSTVAKLVAKRLGYLYIDTGAMYRAVAWKAIKSSKLKVKSEKLEEAEIVKLANQMEIKLKPEGGVFVDGEEVTEEIRTPEVSRLASPVSAIKGVRDHLTSLQRKMGEEGGVVMEGRDIGTVVFPQAEAKIYLTASVEERARRRYKELVDKGFKVNLKKIEEEIKVRDHNDSTRLIAPLRKASGALVVDSDGKSIEKVVEEIVSVVQMRLANL
ncbi:MAG: cytidylate kinase [Armatimonadetes bacterium CG07_land_8_20_14_0_80_40_9]|nr:MAG: cytidylate kinase [Armatimonadetes bacterium CG07_land_8_20_14_0_80_40_9]